LFSKVIVNALLGIHGIPVCSGFYLLHGFVKKYRLIIVTPLQFEIIDQLFFTHGIVNGNANLDPAMQVPVHPVGRTDHDFAGIFRAEYKDPGMFQVPVDNSLHGNIFTDLF
jgi:hypothetical protein